MCIISNLYSFVDCKELTFFELNLVLKKFRFSLRPEVELIVARGKAGGVDGGVGEVDDLVHGDDGHVVVQTRRIEGRVLHNRDSLVLLHRSSQGFSDF